MTSRAVAVALLAGTALALAGSRGAQGDGAPPAPAASEEAPVTALTRTPMMSEMQPAWSPDGKWIAFTATDSLGATDLWLISADGTTRRRLTDDGLLKGSPAWSPDGKRIAFHAARERSNFQIWVLDLADSTLTAVTHEAKRTMNPAWSPDGAEISYFGVASGDEQVWAIPASGGKARRLTFHATQSWSAAWSPDGKEIVFSGYRNQQTGGSLFIMPREGEGASCDRSRPLTRRLDHGWDRFPAWSPDGRWVAFAANDHAAKAEDFDIWLVAVDGSVEIPLTRNPAADSDPAWAPDGRRLVFESNRSGSDELWLLDVSRWTSPPPKAP